MSTVYWKNMECTCCGVLSECYVGTGVAGYAPRKKPRCNNCRRGCNVNVACAILDSTTDTSDGKRIDLRPAI